MYSLKFSYRLRSVIISDYTYIYIYIYNYIVAIYMVLHIIIIIGGSHDSGLFKALMESPSHSVQKPACCDCCILCWVDQINIFLFFFCQTTKSADTVNITKNRLDKNPGPIAFK